MKSLQDILEFINRTYHRSITLDAERRKQRSRPWFWSRQEFLRGKPLWEHVFSDFNLRKNVNLKLGKIEKYYGDWRYYIENDKTITDMRKKNKSCNARVNAVLKSLAEGMRSAILDQRLAPLVVKTRPSWIHVPAHVSSMLTGIGLTLLNKKTVLAGIVLATAGATPELAPYVTEVTPIIRDRMVFTGSTVIPALMFVWLHWRTKVTIAQKKKIKNIKDTIDELRKSRDLRLNRTNVLLNKKIVDLEKQLQTQLNAAFVNAYKHRLPLPEFEGY